MRCRGFGGRVWDFGEKNRLESLDAGSYDAESLRTHIVAGGSLVAAIQRVRGPEAPNATPAGGGEGLCLGRKGQGPRGVDLKPPWARRFERRLNVA